MTRLRRRVRSDDDAGWVTAFVIIFAVALVFVSGLVLDGGRMLSEHRRAGNLADSAARAGAQAIDEDLVREGQTVLDPGAAEAAACAFVAGTGYTCNAEAVGNQIDVVVTGDIDLWLLPGANPQVEAEGSACVAVGIGAATC